MKQTTVTTKFLSWLQDSVSWWLAEARRMIINDFFSFSSYLDSQILLFHPSTTTDKCQQRNFDSTFKFLSYDGRQGHAEPSSVIFYASFLSGQPHPIISSGQWNKQLMQQRLRSTLKSQFTVTTRWM
jgi:hypothetical protein